MSTPTLTFKKLIRIIFFAFCFVPFVLFSQSKITKPNIFELNIGNGITFHNGTATDLIQFFDARSEPISQEKRTGNSFQFQYFKELKSRHSLGLNLSYTAFKYFESGNSYSWGKFIGTYEDDIEFRFIGFGLAYNYSVPLKKFDKLNFGIDIGSWRGTAPLKPKYFKYWFKGLGQGFKSRLNINYAHSITKNIDLSVGGYLLSALNSHLGDSYYPYSYGVALGIQYKVDRIFNLKKKISG